MNRKRCIYTGFMLWVIILLETYILMLGLRYSSDDARYYFFHFFFGGIIIAFASLVYFRANRVKKDAKEGLMLGVCFALLSIVLDAFIKVPLLFRDYNFFTDAGLWIGYLEIIVIAGLVGMARGKQA